MNVTTTVAAIALALVTAAPVRMVANWAFDEQPASAGIIIHSLTYINHDKPIVVQDRTITASNSLVANWKAYVRLENDPIGMEFNDRICKGSGWWNYSGGHKSAIIDFDDWVGDVGCFERLPRGQNMQICASYFWGDGEKTQQCSNGFKLDE
jgi:hypothetical protein